jgi:hypothetical protein
MNGPVVWNANANRVTHPAQPLFIVAHEDRALTVELLRQKRVAVNLAAISAIVKNIEEHITPPQQTLDYLLDVGHAWETIGSLL